VHCANEHAGSLERDPEIWRHLDGEREDSIQAVTLRVLAEAAQHGTTAVAAANRLADQRAEELHPIWGHRAKRIIDSLLNDGWTTSGDVR
jgi:cytosine/adenosine deaminase-related metal-dependent hydrolase